MKKALLVLGLATLMVGLAQAQTPQVRLVWEKQFRGQGGILTAVDTFQGKLQVLAGVGGQYVNIDTTGAITPLFAVPPGYGANLLNGGRFITLWPGWQNPGPTYLYDYTGRQLAVVTLGDRLGISSVSQDGKHFAAKMFRWSPEANYPNGEIRLFGEGGQLKGVIRVERHYSSGMSPDGSRYVVQSVRNPKRPDPDKFDPTLLVYDQNGRELWKVSDVVCYSLWTVLPDNRVFVYCVSKDNKSYGRFYDGGGRLLREYPLPHIQSVDDKLLPIPGTMMAILNSNRKFTCCFKMDTGEMLWQKETSGNVVVVSRDGSLIVMWGGRRDRKPHCSTTVFDGNGNVLFEKPGTDSLQFWSNIGKAKGKGWFVAQEGDFLKLYAVNR